MELSQLNAPGTRRSIVVIALGAGVLIGSGVCWWWLGRRLTDAVHQLSEQIQALRREVERLRLYVEEQVVSPEFARFRRPNNTEDDDDIFEDAYDGPVSWVGGLSADQVSSCSEISNHVVSENDKNTLFSRIDRLLDSSDEDKCTAFQQLTECISQHGTNAEFLWRLSKATYFMSQLEATGDKSKQKSLVYRAVESATKALQLDDNNPNVHKWYAITLGSIGDYEGVSVKIENGFKFRTHIEKAIQLNPKDPTAHYLLGRWCFGVYMLSWVERKMAAALFAVPPTATVDEALQHFMEADRLNPSKWKENLLFIAKCYIEKRDYRSCVQWLDKADVLPASTRDDQVNQQEVSALLRQYSMYRQ